MKKLLLCLTLCLSASLASAGTYVNETFSKVIQTSSAPANTKWQGDFFEWTVYNIRRGTSDLINGTTTQGAWFSALGYVKSSVEIEGGIKSLSFQWSQFGNEANKKMQLIVSVDGVKIDTLVHLGLSSATGTANTYLLQNINHKKNFLLELYNASFLISDNTPNGRFVLGNPSWEPYLFFTTRSANITAGDKYTNTGLINNLDGDMAAPTFSSSNTNIATVNPTTGEVTGVAEGSVTITATSDLISTKYTLNVAPQKPYATLSFAANYLLKQENDALFINTLTHNSDGALAFSSSNTNCATVAADGQITIRKHGITTITATTSETNNFQQTSTSYTLEVKPLAWMCETFAGATTPGTGTYNTTVMSGTSSATNITWNVFLGSIRADIGAFGHEAICIRGRKLTALEQTFDYAYIQSSTIAGGLDSLSFTWNTNGSETGRTWDVDIFVNNNLVGKISEAAGPQLLAKPYHNFAIGNLKIEGDYTIKIVNNSNADADANQYRMVIDDIHLYGYQSSTTTDLANPTLKFIVFPTAVKEYININTNEANYLVKVYNQIGQVILQQSNASSLNLSALTAGIYVVETSSNTSKELTKIIKY